MKKAVFIVIIVVRIRNFSVRPKKFCFEISWGKFIYNNCGW